MTDMGTDNEKQSSRQVLFTLVRWVALAIVVAAAVWAVVSQWEGVKDTITTVHPLSLALSAFFLIVGLLLGTWAWRTMLNGLGHKVPVIAAFQISLVGQLGKYVPGAVWAYLLQMELGRRHHLSRARVLSTALFSAGVGVVCSLLVGLAMIPVIVESNKAWFYLFLLLPVGLICLHPKVMTWMAHIVFKLFRRPRPDLQLHWSTVAKTVGWTLLSYCCYGAHLWILANSVGEPKFSTLILCIGACGLGMTAGLFAFFLPSGMGAREAVLVAALATVLTTAQATTMAIGSRLMFTVVELALAGVAALVAVRSSRRLAALETALDDD